LQSSLFWDVTQHRLVISHRRFGTKYRSHFQESGGPIGCPETSVTNYTYLRCVTCKKGEDLFYTAAAGKLKARKVNRKEILVGGFGKGSSGWRRSVANSFKQSKLINSSMLHGARNLLTTDDCRR